MGDGGKQAARDQPFALDLGGRAVWTGAAIYVFASLVYLSGLAFEALVANRIPLSESAFMSWVPAVASNPEQLSLGLEWRASVLLLIGTAFGALLVSCGVLVRSLRERTGPTLVLGVLVALVAVATAAIRSGVESTSVLISLCDQLEADSPLFGERGVSDLVLKPKLYGELLAGLVGLAMASILLLPARLTSESLATRVRHLRMVLYSSAAMLVFGVLMTRAAYAWSASYFMPAAGQAELVDAGTILAGSFYTMMLGAIYLPCAVALSRNAQRLAKRAVETGQGKSEHGWLEENDLQVSWKGNSVRILAVVSPMLTAFLPGIGGLLG
jgi:hypothetical protein